MTPSLSPALTQTQIDLLIADTRAIEARDGVPVETAFVRAWLRSVIVPIVSAALRRRSLSPALEGDLAAFGPPLFRTAPDFARAVERVGKVEQRRAALPFALGGQFCRADAQRFGVGVFGHLPATASDSVFHAPNLRASVVARQCDAFPFSHPEKSQ